MFPQRRRAMRWQLSAKTTPVRGPLGRGVHVSSWHLADMAIAVSDVRFSNRPFGVKHFQTVHRCSVDVTHGLVLLFGIGTKALVWGFFSQEV